ncbi:WD40/YVTN repeat-like-containing domain [Lasallia pustulata]|uniref:WD40/YVTN repeat-like-containing domain n=1 Tax=Lasallia pustulata TaxID=136370 RepID=A0A1W5D0A6_9LECA|nr:WD40/YVTN repeat-like-containing domain [Lasallia pustulata]
MAHFLRGKQAGIQNDLSAGLAPELFAIDEVARYGINSKISALAYDPVQSLLAVGTHDSPYGLSQISVFGQKRVNVTFTTTRKASIKSLQFCADKLISVDSKNDISVFSLETKRMNASYAPPGLITALATDPALDYALVGLQNGDVIAYDLDREAPAPFKIPNFWRERNPRAPMIPVVTLALHPRDIGTLLIGYSEGAVIYSFKQNKATKFFQYELQPGCPGGDSDPMFANKVRRPKLNQALWHPTGTFILTGHEDCSLVFWDVKDGRLLVARTLEDTQVDRPKPASEMFGSTTGTVSLKEPLFRVAWCCKENLEDTGVLVCGGASMTRSPRGLTFLDLGSTPIYATCTWQILADYFEKPKKQHILPTPPNTEVVDFCLLPRSSPHFAGSHDPIAVIALLASGEIVTLSFPSGHPITPTNQLHVSLSFVHPYINCMAIASIDRTRWLGMTENRLHGPPLLRGGAEAAHPLKRYESRNVLQTAHVDGTIRLWDAGHGDEVENEDMLQVDVARAIGRFENVDISKTSMSGVTGELAVGLSSGELVAFRWDHNRNFGREVPHSHAEGFGLETIKDRADPAVKEGLLPLTMLKKQEGFVSALKMSDIGFIGVGFEGGSVAVIDLRGPALIYNAKLSDISKQSTRGSIRRSGGQSQSRPEWPTVIEFGVMSLDGEDYSSILTFVGTNLGRLLTFKLLPESHGGYAVHLAGICSLDDRIISILPVNVDTGAIAHASPSVVANLRSGCKVNGVLLVVTPSGARIFKPAATKGAQKTWDDFLCDAANVVRFEDRGYALVGLFGDGRARAYSIPGLKEIASADTSQYLDVKRLSEALITATGDVFGWAGPSEIAVLNVWGTGQKLPRSLDKLFNVEALIPPRPTISNIQWISGTQYVSPSDMDILIGGPDRPPSKRMIEQMRAEEQQRRIAGRPAPSAPSAASGQDEGYWAYMQRQVQERTERLGIMGDSMDMLEENSSGWANDVSKYVNQQKRKVILGAIGSKLGF